MASDKLFVAANNFVGFQKTTFSVVRYGNVGFSRGSVIPIFLKQKQNKQKFFTVTDKKMTRFWISLEESVKFTIDCFNRMKGGEIFIPKIPSMYVTDIAKAIDPNFKIKVIGIRPGEKLHEVLCSREDNKQTLEFKDHFIIAPNIIINNKIQNYNVDKRKEKGKIVKENFIYDSGSNKHFLKISQIKKKISKGG